MKVIRYAIYAVIALLLLAVAAVAATAFSTQLFVLLVARGHAGGRGHAHIRHSLSDFGAS